MARILGMMRYRSSGRAVFKSIIETSDLEVQLEPGMVVGHGIAQFVVRGVTFANQLRVALVRVPEDELGDDPDRLYAKYRKSHNGDVVYPGMGLLATNEYSAKGGYFHSRVPPVPHYLGAVLIALGSHPSVIFKEHYIDLPAECGEREHFAADDVAKHHFDTDGRILHVPIDLEDRDKGYRDDQRRVVNATFMVNWVTMGDGSQHLHRVLLTPEADLDAVGRRLDKVFGLKKTGLLVDRIRRAKGVRLKGKRAEVRKKLAQKGSDNNNAKEDM